jgi:dihydrofolate reductase
MPASGNDFRPGDGLHPVGMAAGFVPVPIFSIPSHWKAKGYNRGAELVSSMRKITVFNYVTLDGFFAGPLGEIDWFKSIKKDKEFDKESHEQAKSGGTVMYGHTTYEMMRNYWPTPEAMRSDPEMAKVVNNGEKIVFSRKLEDVEEGPNWKNVSLLKEITKDNITKLKKQKGRDITVIGSGSVIRQLTDLGLIDEYQLMVVPVVLGTGKSFFTNVRQMDLELIESKAYGNGLVRLRYRPV